MADKNSFVLYADYKDKFSKLTNAQFGELMRMVFTYESGEEPETEDMAVDIAFNVIRYDLDKNREKYEEIVEKRREAGRNKSNQMQANDSKCKQMLANASKCQQVIANDSITPPDSVSDSDSVSVSVSDNNASESAKGVQGGKRKRFQPPTKEDIQDYCAQKGLTVDADRFIDYYSAQGWKLSNGNAMRDWRAAVRNWSRDKKPRATAKNRFNDFDQRSYSGDDYKVIEDIMKLRGRNHG